MDYVEIKCDQCYTSLYNDAQNRREMNWARMQRIMKGV